MRRALSAVALIALGAAALAVTERRSTGDTGVPPPTIELPKSASATAAASPSIPAVPAAADSLPPLAFTLTTVWEGPGSERRKTTQSVMRTVDRVRIVPDGLGKEWFFERNPVHGTRVSGYLVDHQSRQIAVHYDSDLRNGQQVRGWADIVMMRFDPQTLNTLRLTGETETAAGAIFARYAAADRSKAGVLDVWWSDSLLLPLRLTAREGKVVTTSTITRLERIVDLDMLREPPQRFPGYEVIDASDARERRHR